MNSQNLLDKISNNGRISVFDLNEDEIKFATEMKKKGLIEVKRFSMDIYGKEHEIPVPYAFKIEKSQNNYNPYN